MSVVKVVYLICDLCRVAQETVGLISVTEAREAARDGGWKRRGVLDICPNCAVTEQGEAQN